MPKVSVTLVKSQDFDPMTKGIHNFTILEAEIKKSKTGNFDNIFWTFECTSSEDDKNVGKKIPNYCTTCKPDCTWALSDLRKACGFEVVEGEELEFGGLLGNGPVMKINRKSPAKLIERGGRIPAPLQSLKN